MDTIDNPFLADSRIPRYVKFERTWVAIYDVTDHHSKSFYFLLNLENLILDKSLLPGSVPGGSIML